MGILGLQTYLENLVHGGCMPVDIVEAAARHVPYCPPGTKPTIVVDSLCLMRWLYNKTDDYIFGGPWRFIAHIVTELVRSFQERGIDLVFYFDGCVCDAKVGMWRSRRLQKSREIMEMYKKLQAGRWMGDDRNLSCPNGTAHALCFMVKHLTSCKVFNAVGECDSEVARYAETHQECFGILSQDSDFSIFNMRVLFLSILHLDMGTLQTCAYSSRALARHLNIGSHLLPLFACLAGNDFVSKEQLTSFHRSLGIPLHLRGRHAFLFERIATVICQRGWSATPDIHVARSVGVDLDSLLNGIRMYDTKEDSCMLKSPPCILQVLHSREVFLGETMAQPIKNKVTAHILFREVRRRIYWVLFKGDTSVVITEHVTYPGTIGVRDEAVTCIPLNIEGEVPELRHLWSEDPSLGFMRWHLFCGCLQMETQMEKLETMPHVYLVFCCTLRHLFLAGVISGMEINALILQCILPDNMKLEFTERHIPHSQVDPNLVSISAHVMVGIQCVTMALIACGQFSVAEDSAPWKYFDGKLFHLIYGDLRKLQTSFSSLLHDNVDIKYLYCRFWEHVTSGSTLQHSHHILASMSK
ncbi:hypothetical protein MTO96_011965 [Rhipicephalus appendiculatus]